MTDLARRYGILPMVHNVSLFSFLSSRRLHSFPTRRSSDLSSSSPSSELRAQDRLQLPDCRGKVRSEEHTSELQSRFDLVCRLLLEKKKKFVLLSARSWFSMREDNINRVSPARRKCLSVAWA